MSVDPQVIDTLGQQSGEAWEALQKAYAAYEAAMGTGSRLLWRTALSVLLARSTAVVENLQALLKAEGE